MDAPTLREYATDAIKFWERVRIFYNLVLAAIVMGYFVAGYPTSKATLSLNFVLPRRYEYFCNSVILGRKANCRD